MRIKTAALALTATIVLAIAPATPADAASLTPPSQQPTAVWCKLFGWC